MPSLLRPLLLAGLLVCTTPTRANDDLDHQLIQAAYDGDAKAVLTLLRQDPSKGAVNQSLYIASLEGHQDTAIALIEHGADVNYAWGPHHDTPLSNAAASNSLRVLRACLDHGGNPNLKCDYGWTALIQAAFSGNVGAVKLLAEHKGTRINAHDIYDFTALSTAARMGNVAIVRYLLTTRADPTVENDRGETALDIARANIREIITDNDLRENSWKIVRMLESRLGTKHP